MDSATNGSSVASISLPKGGGSVQGIGETFQPNPFSGTGNFTIPIRTSPGRGGFEPQLALNYSTGSGNGPFGLGWRLDLPKITRKTEKGLPRYQGKDVFVLSGAEDLVPLETETKTSGGLDYSVTYYRPRTEGLFARIERWQRAGTDDFWLVISRDNVTSVYGRDQNARIHHPDRDLDIYCWLLGESFDAKGEHIRFEYVAESGALSIDELHEQKRTFNTQRYIRRIYYGNVPDDLPDDMRVGPERGNLHYLYEVLFDYGDLPDAPEQAYLQPPAGNETLPSTLGERPDAFSTYRAGFEVRTLRRCRRILMVHHFRERDVGPGTLVRSTELDYRTDEQSKLSLLRSVVMTGYRRDGTAYVAAETPPVEFRYTEFKPQAQRYQSLEALEGNNPAFGLGHPNLALVDLNGNGLGDLLHTTDNGYNFWENLGNGRFDHPRTMSQAPAGITLAQPGVSLADLAGDGRADLLVFDSPEPGFFESQGADTEQTWSEYRHIHSLPGVNLGDPNLQLVDLTGDGLSDILLTGDHHFLWFRSLGEEGYAEPEAVERIHDLDTFPDVYFSDPGRRVRLADMTGDGLNDIVLLHNGRVDYWPNLGFGRFGNRITMSAAPRLETNFNPARLFLADLDGSGCADLVYVDFDRVRFWSTERATDGATSR